MRLRPIAPLIAALNDLGARCAQRSRHRLPAGCRPRRWAARRSDPDGRRLSSQYFSALLLSAPYARDGVAVDVIGDLVSKPYLPMTAGGHGRVRRDGGSRHRLLASHRSRSGQRYTGRLYHIEPDASNASYFFAAAAVTGGRVRIDGLGRGSTQGDLRFVDVLAKMGAEVEIGDDYTEVRGPAQGDLRGVDLDLGPISDTAQTLAAIAPFASGATTIRGIAHARLKETDRVSALATRAAPAGPGGRGVSGRLARSRPRRLAAGGNRHLRRSPHGDELCGGRAARSRHPPARSWMRGQDVPRVLRRARRGDSVGAAMFSRWDASLAGLVVLRRSLGQSRARSRRLSSTATRRAGSTAQTSSRSCATPPAQFWRESELMIGQPPLGSYLMGLGLTLQGRDLDTNGFYDFHFGPDWNRRHGNMPDEADLAAARRTNSVVGALIAVCVYLIARGLSNAVAGHCGRRAAGAASACRSISPASPDQTRW